MKILETPLHPFLLAAYFPLWLLSSNIGLFDIGDAARALAWNLALTLAIVAVLRPIYGDWDRPAALASALIVFLFSYSVVTNHVPGFGSGYPTLALIAVLWSLLAFLFLRAGMTGGSLTRVLNAVLVVMSIGPAVEILSARSLAGPIDTVSDSAILAELASAPGPVAGDEPTIHHIVLDGYSRGDVLRDVYGFDNEPFLEALREMGFTVSEGATTPYGQTLLAMSAIFSLNYLDEHLAVLTSSSEDPSDGYVRRRLSRHFWNSPVRRALASRGYRFVAIDTEYGPLRVGNADEFLAAPNLSGLTYFERLLYEMTPFLRIHHWRSKRGDGLSREAMRVAYALDHDEPPDLPSPALVYNHIVSPHPPFSINHEGGPRPLYREGLADGNHWRAGDPQREALYHEGYLEKLRYTNAALIEHLSGLIERADRPLIIVVHGDHGGGLLLNHDDSEATCAKERFATLLAVYSSGGGVSAAIGDDVNLVNLYRVLFNAEFGSALPELSDRSLFAPWHDLRAIETVDPRRIANYDENCVADRARL